MQAANLEVAIGGGYFAHLSAYLILNDLNNARFLWKRIPADTKKVHAQLLVEYVSHLIRLYQSLLLFGALARQCGSAITRKYVAFYSMRLTKQTYAALSGYAWPSNITGFVMTLAGMTNSS